MSQLDTPLEALDLAIQLIESYQMDIRNSAPVVGVDLKKLGFCQGRVYIQGHRRLVAAYNRFAEEGK